VPAGQETGVNESLFGDNRVAGEEEKKFRINGRLSFDIQQLQNFDLDDEDDEHITRVSPEARIEFTYEPDDDFQAFLSLEFGLDMTHLEGDWDTDGRAEIREAYILAEDLLFRNSEFQLGRQDVEDGREWLYDEQLDGVRLGYDHKDLEVYAGYFREELIEKDIFDVLDDDDDERDKVDNFVVHAEYEMKDDWDIAAYVLKQEDRRAGDVSPLFVGIQSEGRITRNFGHWLDAAIQRGEVGNRDQKAWAVDAGLIWFFDSPIRPAIFGGYARGSGGGDADTNKEFRQSGLQDNEDRITGLGNVKYYGELLDPELSNLEIFTVGGGLRPTDSSSIELLWHKYRQVELDDDDIRGSPVNVELEGDSHDIGEEIDLVGAIRLGGGFGLEAKFGWFNPGKGFDEDERDDAFFAKARVVYRF
jgi:alginate production protein